MAHKYGAKRTVVDGHTFDSMAEARRYKDLKLLQSVGEIRDLRLQPQYEVYPAYKHPVTGKRIRAITYRADFLYYDCIHEKWVVEDVKGMQTPQFRLKRKIVEHKYKIRIEVFKY